jgi:hypothetical protein
MTAPAAAVHYQRGEAGSRFPRWLLLVVFGVLIAVAVGVTVAVVKSLAPTVKAQCSPDRPCPPPSGAPPLTVGKVWTNPALGFSLEYNDRLWKVDRRDSRNLALSFTKSGYGTIALLFQAVPASEATPSQLLDQRLSDLRGRTIGLAADHRVPHTLLGPIIGYHHAIGRVYAGMIDESPSPSVPVNIILLGAGDNRVTTAVTVATATQDDSHRLALLELADSLDPVVIRTEVEERFSPEHMVGNYVAAYEATIEATASA